MRPAIASSIQVLVVHSDPILAAGLRAMLLEQPGIQLRSQDDQGAGDVILTDFEHGLPLAEELRKRSPGGSHPRVMVVARQEREHEVRRALESGVQGFVVQGCRPDELIDGVRALAVGRCFMCTTVAQCVAQSINREALTAREAEVLALLAEGHCNKTIARELRIAVGTVKAHLKGIMGKLGVGSRTQALSVAAARGLVSPSVQRPSPGHSRAPMLAS